MSSSCCQNDQEKDKADGLANNVHDLIALGEIKSALDLNYRNSESSTRLSKNDQVLRLPLLLRLLSMLQPLSSVPSIHTSPTTTIFNNDQERNTDGKQNLENDDAYYQDNVDKVVASLEKVAASFPAAEGVDVLTYYLAPEACSKVSKCASLTRKRKTNLSQYYSDTDKNENHEDDNNNQSSTNSSNSGKTSNNENDPDSKKIGYVEKLIIGTFWNTDSLEYIGDKNIEKSKNLVSNVRRNGVGNNVKVGEDTDQVVESGTNRILAQLVPKKRRKMEQGKMLVSSASSSLFTEAQESSSAAAEDSQESTVEKILAEIISLILSGLEPMKLNVLQLHNNLGDDESINNPIQETTVSSTSSVVNSQRKEIKNEEGKHDVNDTKADDDTKEENKSGIFISIKPDSLLAERPATTGTDDISGNWNSGSDMAATVSTLLHYAPVLRYEHLANALCRSAVPQCSSIIIRLGANCPASTACILRGCLNAYESAIALLSSTLCPNAISSAHSVIKCCKFSIKGIANLSKRESCLVCSTLLSHGEKMKINLPDILLETMISYDKEGAIMIMLKELLLYFKATFWERSKSEHKVKPQSSAIGLTKKNTSSKQGNDMYQYSQSGPKGKPVRIFKQRKIRKSHVTLPLTKKNQAFFVKLPSLAEVLISNKNFASSMRRCILSCLESTIERTKSTEGSFIPWSKASLYLQTFAILVCHVGIGAGSSFGSGSTFVESSMNAISLLIDNLNAHRQNNQPTQNQSCSSEDDFYKHALCACIIICCNFPPIADAKGHFMGGSAMVACSDCFTNLLFHHSGQGISEQSNVFASRVVGCIVSEDAIELQRVVLTSIFPNWDCLKDFKGDEGKSNQLNSFFNVCRWCSSKLSSGQTTMIQTKGLSLSAVCVDISATVDAFDRCRITDKEMDTLLLSILQDSDVCSKIYHQEKTLELLEHSVKLLHKRAPPIIPLILPLQLEDLGNRIHWDTILGRANIDIGNNNYKLCFQFSLQLLYALLFLEKKGLFSINPRTLPLYEVLEFTMNQCSLVDSKIKSSLVYTKIFELVSMYCPDIALKFKNKGEYSENLLTSLSSDFFRNVSLSMVTDAIQSTLFNQSSRDRDGCRAKRLFACAHEIHSFSQVDIEATRALLSTQNTPLPSFTYDLLCEDPLLLLKCSYSAWRNDGLRYIIITILSRLLEANNSIISNMAQTEDVMNELLAARDSLILKCLLTVGSGDLKCKGISNETPKPMYCPMLASLLCSMVKRQRGLVATIIKQGISETMTDWLIENVPECSMDAQILTECLSDKTMTAAERLYTADASLRIAIAHGSRNEADCQKLSHTALSVLLSSFFLVLGPIGVAVNVMCEENGQDVTKKFRRSTLRMIYALQNIKSDKYSSIKEAKMILSKIIVLCKSDNLTGIPVGIATMRRNVLKEIYDSCVRAINSMGGGVQV